MRWRLLAWAGVAAAVVAAVALGVFWKVRGLEEAGWLAGVLGTLAGLTALVITLVDLARRHRAGPSPGPESSAPGSAEAGEGAESGAGATINTFGGGSNVGPLVMGRTISGSVTSGSAGLAPPGVPAADPPSAGPMSGSEPAAGADADSGSVTNTFSGGINQGPLIMGRTISGPVSSGLPPPHVPPAADSRRGDDQDSSIPSGEASEGGSDETSAGG